MVATSIVVISDLHIGEGVLDDFDAELESHLVDFLNHLGAPADPVEFVINGDFLDFVQASPWRGAELEAHTGSGAALCFTEEQSGEKFAAIRDAHPTIFDALRGFLARNPGHRLVVIPGNHDVDFFWSSVRAAFFAACAPGPLSAQVVFHLERVYRPTSAPWLWIEHGHQYDSVNAFVFDGEERWSETRPPIMCDQSGTQRLCECVGTRFMIRFINHLDARYPLVDNVKPFSRFLKIFGASILRTGHGALDAVIAVTQMTWYLTRTLSTRPGDILTDPDLLAGIVTNPLAAWVENAAAPDRDKLKAALREVGFRIPAGLDLAVERAADAEKILETLAEHLELVQGLGERDDALLGTASGTLALGASFFGDETEDLRAGAKHAGAQDGVRTVVMGHTHEPVHDIATYAYFNTGSWTRYYVFEDTEKTQPWRMLRKSSYERFPYRLQYLLVQPGADQATLELWRERKKS